FPLRTRDGRHLWRRHDAGAEAILAQESSSQVICAPRPWIAQGGRETLLRVRRMARSSSSSSSSSGERGKKDKKKKGKKEKKEKKDKKDKKGKKDKKDKKAASKEAQARSRAAAWECDRAEAKRLVKSLLELDAEVAEELGAVFEGLDSGALVRLECVADKQARKKLRHLLQAPGGAPSSGG
ncbi:unnamed protein product, partial [Prorocentrum cordatum]